MAGYVTVCLFCMSVDGVIGSGELFSFSLPLVWHHGIPFFLVSEGCRNHRVLSSLSESRRRQVYYQKGV